MLFWNTWSNYRFSGIRGKSSGKKWPQFNIPWFLGLFGKIIAFLEYSVKLSFFQDMEVMWKKSGVYIILPSCLPFFETPTNSNKRIYVEYCTIQFVVKKKGNDSHIYLNHFQFYFPQDLVDDNNGTGDSSTVCLSNYI